MNVLPASIALAAARVQTATCNGQSNARQHKHGERLQAPADRHVVVAQVEGLTQKFIHDCFGRMTVPKWADVSRMSRSRRTFWAKQRALFIQVQTTRFQLRLNLVGLFTQVDEMQSPQ